MKVLLIILDGLADRPSSELAGQTPLEAALTSNLDRLASRGLNGFMYTISPGMAPSSDLAHFLLFGYSLAEFPGRGYLEAIGEGFSVQVGEVVLRTSFVSAEEKEGRFEIVSRDVKVTEEECQAFAEAVKSKSVRNIKSSFVYTGKRQGLLFLSGKASAEITDSDPFDNKMPVVKVQALAEAEDRTRTEQTTTFLNQFLIEVYDTLSVHPVNEKRRKDGLAPLNFLTTKWAGREHEVASFWDRYGFKGASIASSPLFKGLAYTVGLDFIDQPGLDDAGDDLAARLQKAAELLQKDYDFIHVHTKFPDEAAHTKNPKHKKEVIEKLDRAFAFLLKKEVLLSECLIVVTADHATPSQGTLIHSGEAVPIFFLGEAAGADEVEKFGENASRKGALGQIYGRDLMPLILNYTDRIKYFGSRNFSQDHPARPSRDRITPLRREP